MNAATSNISCLSSSSASRAAISSRSASRVRAVRALAMRADLIASERERPDASSWASALCASASSRTEIAKVISPLYYISSYNAHSRCEPVTAPKGRRETGITANRRTTTQIRRTVLGPGVSARTPVRRRARDRRAPAGRVSRRLPRRGSATCSVARRRGLSPRPRRR